MKPKLRLILLALIIFILGTAPAINAQISTTTFENPKVVFCNDIPVSGEIYSPAQDPAQVDYYKISLLSGQRLVLDVDAETIGSTLDALLEVFEPDKTPVDANNDQINDPNDPTDDSLDPYLEIAASSNDVTYIIAISSGSTNPSDTADSSNAGNYKLSLQCSDQYPSAEFKWPVEVGDLLGATGSKTGSLININPEKAESSLPFPLGIGPITDIEYDPSSKLVFVAIEAAAAVDDLAALDAFDTIEYNPAQIVAIDPESGNVVESYSLEAESVVALEAAENKLYGVRVDPSGSENFTLAQVIFDNQQKIAKLTDVVSFGSDVRALAYDQSHKVMYGASGVNLFKINLASSPVEIVTVALTGLSQNIVALDFSHEDVLYGVDRSRHLFNVPDLSSGEVGLIGEPIPELNGLTFVIGEPPPDVEPIKTLCSSTLTATTTGSSETDSPKLSKLKLKNNPLHRAIGLFKFQGKAGEKITLRLAPEGEEAAVADEVSSLRRLAASLLECKGKGQVFLGIRDAIPNVDFRARKKGQMPFEMSVDLRDDGYYYVMVIRPLLRFYQTDYCLTLESDHPESVAWETLDVVWPGDNSEEDTAATSTEEKAVFVSVDEASDQMVQEVEETTIEGTGETAPVEEIKAEITEQPTVMGAPPVTEESTIEPAPVEETTAEATVEPSVKMGTAPSIVEETTVDETDEVVAPAEEPTAEATEEPAMMGAPSIPEETTLNETGEVAPEESADEISGDNASAADGSGSAEVVENVSDGAESADMGTSEVVEEKPMTEVPTS